MEALLFDCDGVLVETEKDGHRVAFNRAFAEAGLTAAWSEQDYARWLLIGGGKERMRAYFDHAGWPGFVQDRDAFIQALHVRKTNLFLELIESRQLPLRPGIARLVDEAIRADLPLAVCSTSNERAVKGVVATLLGPERAPRIRIFAGDMARKKKPDPEIYRLAQREMKVTPDRCVVIEDSRNGVLAAVAAVMRCLVTQSAYTVREDFSAANAVVPSLDEGPNGPIHLADIERLLLRGPREAGLRRPAPTP